MWDRPRESVRSRALHGWFVGVLGPLLLTACSATASTAGPTGAAAAQVPTSSAPSGTTTPAATAAATGRSTVPTTKPASPDPTSKPPTSTTGSAQPCLHSVVVGYSVRRRAIVACERGTPGGVALVAVGVIHGNEQLGLSVLSRLRRLPVPRGVDLWTISAVNPDGLAAGTRQNAHHVDLNRNWPLTWQPSSPSSATYGGPSAGSEPETRALQAFFARLKPRTVLVFHSPLDAVDYSEGADPAVTRYMAKASGYPARTLGSRPGSLTGWFNGQAWGGTAITFEFASSASSTQLDRVARAVLSLAAWRAG
ncbi:MAG: M14 family zinc carboxypeptidase [Actinomycetes bacterium]